MKNKKNQRKKDIAHFQKMRQKIKSNWAIVLIDDKPIKKKAIKQYLRSKTQLQTVKEHIDRYFNVDRKQFEQWFYKKFGVVLTLIRELKAKNQNVHNLIDDVRYYAFYEGIREHKAYQFIQAFNQNNSISFKEWYMGKTIKVFFGEDDEDEEWDDEDDDEKDEDHVCHICKKCGVCHACEDDAEDETDFDDFMEDTLEELFSGYQKSEHKDTSNKQTHGNNRQKRVETEEDPEIKKIYRDIALKIHPDRLDEKPNPYFSNLWHQTQIAYKNGDLERLIELQSEFIVGQEQNMENLPVSEIMAATTSLKNSLAPLNREIKRYKKAPEWGFSQITNTVRVQQEIKSEMDMEISRLQQQNREMEVKIQDWEKKLSEDKQKIMMAHEKKQQKIIKQQKVATEKAAATRAASEVDPYQLQMSF